MKRILTSTFLPLVLVALESVNLIKDGGFEKDSDVWVMSSRAGGLYDSTIISRHDLDSTYMGEYCGSIDTRTKPMQTPPTDYFMLGSLCQYLTNPKKLEDIDSLEFAHMVIYRREGIKISTWGYSLKLAFTNPSTHTLIETWYRWDAPDLEPPWDEPTEKYFTDTMPDEGLWVLLKRDIETDLITTKGLSSEIVLDSFVFWGYANCSGDWRGQKSFFDAIRLTGYVDYDVGVKEILSGDSVWAGVYYKPVARIKSFGRQAADDFLAITEIWQGETLVWADTIPYTLPADTEDTLEFDSFPIPNALSYTLTVRTEMEPDESDEDDVMSKPLYGTAIVENPQSQAVTLEVQSFTANPRISYTLPQGQRGTISIYDASGRKVESKIIQGSGKAEFLPLISGVYFMKLESGKINITRKVVLLK